MTPWPKASFEVISTSLSRLLWLLQSLTFTVTEPGYSFQCMPSSLHSAALWTALRQSMTFPYICFT